MNKKGFTLMELLCTITIIGIIATMISINTMEIFDAKKQAQNNQKKEIIEESACVYLELDENKVFKDNCKINGCTISTNELIKSGLLSSQDVDNEQIINITYQNNEKKCEVKE